MLFNIWSRKISINPRIKYKIAGQLMLYNRNFYKIIISIQAFNISLSMKRFNTENIFGPYYVETLKNLKMLLTCTFAKQTFGK